MIQKITGVNMKQTVLFFVTVALLLFCQLSVQAQENNAAPDNALDAQNTGLSDNAGVAPAEGDEAQDDAAALPAKSAFAGQGRIMFIVGAIILAFIFFRQKNKLRQLKNLRPNVKDLDR
ncbi:MAG: hypothetical protein HQM16_09855 [Deltaproteobacteria bacterium]|nr:hypothetical protein [Deltaproteobacteria bacterium]